jgi:uncharacterized Zn finger protein (UPF0148 family)
MEELRAKIVEILGTETDPHGEPDKYLIRDEYDQIVQGIDFKPEIDALVAVTQAAAERARVEGIKRQIEEIEDISQSRDVIVNPDGTILCSHCTMQLETEDEDCACEILYRKRKVRIERLRAELTGPGDGSHGKGL